MLSELDKYQVIKVPLAKILRDPEKNHPILFSAVKNCHIIVSLAYQLLRLYYLNLFEANKPLPILNQTICEYATSIINSPNKDGCETDLKRDLRDFYHSEYKSTIHYSLNYTGVPVSTILQSLSKEMATMFENNISMHFIKRLRLVIRHKLKTTFPKWDKYQINRGVSKIYDCLFDRDASNLSVELLPIYNFCLHEFIPEQAYTKSLAYDVEAHTHRYLLPTFKLNQYLELNKCKLFQPLPLRKSMVPCHIPLDTNALNCLFDLTKLTTTYNTKNKLSKGLVANPELKYLIWNHLFKLDNKVFKMDMNFKRSRSKPRYKFIYSITTDGVSCSIKFCHREHIDLHNNRFVKKDLRKTPFLTDEAEFIENDEYLLKIGKISKVERGKLLKMSELTPTEKAFYLKKPLVGGDPGLGNLIQLVNKKQHLKYTRQQRYRETHIIQNQKTVHKLRTLKIEVPNHYIEPNNPEPEPVNIQSMERCLNAYNSKTMDYDYFKEFLYLKNQVTAITLTHYLKAVYRKMGLRHYIYTKVSEARLVRNIKATFGSDIVILYGNWSRSTHMKYNAPVPGKGLRDLLAKYFTVIITDEFRSSSICYYSQDQVANRKFERQGAKKKKTKTNKKKIHRCLVCEECCSSKNGGKVPRFMNRDIMGALNILMLGQCDLKNKERPKAYKRAKFGKEETQATSSTLPKVV